MRFSAQAPCTQEAIFLDVLHSRTRKPCTLGAAVEEAIQTLGDNPGAHVLNVSAQIPAILKGNESVGAVVLHVGVNNTKLRQTETLKRDFQEPERDSTQTIIVSGPLPPYRRGHERFSSLL